MWRALKDYKDSNADFPDHLLARVNEQAGCVATVTFDKKAAKQPIFELLKGTEIFPLFRLGYTPDYVAFNSSYFPGFVSFFGSSNFSNSLRDKSVNSSATSNTGRPSL